ncbi:MAG: acyl-CoA thioesterase [Notoacmeibacter sp.]
MTTSTADIMQINEPMQHLLQILDITKTGDFSFRGESIVTSWSRVFGGQVIAQALVAAQRSVDPKLSVHSLHAYFILAGDSSLPIDYVVDPIRDGRSFATRRVVASQLGRAIFALSASFQTFETGLEHQFSMPDVAGPETLMSDSELLKSFGAKLPDAVQRAWSKQRPIEFKPVSLAHFMSKEKLPPVQRIWLRAKGALPDDQQTQTALLAYFSDMTLLDSALYAHGRSIFDASMQVASLDHAMWFHGPVDLSQWHLYDQDSPWTGGARGLTRGQIFAHDGRLVASVAQEGLMRERR